MNKESLLSFVASIILWGMAIGFGYLSAKGQPAIVEILFIFSSVFTALMSFAAMFASVIFLSEKKKEKHE